jgi:uncharacterized protein (DUF885 family)
MLGLWGGVLLAGCSGAAPKRAGTGETTRASRALNDLAQEFWREQMRHSPTWATALGDRSRDNELGDPSPSERTRHEGARQQMFERLRMLQESLAHDLTERERVTADLLRFELETSLEVEALCQGDLWVVDQLAGPQVTLAELPNFHSVSNAAQGRALLERYRRMGAYLAAHVANLRVGLAEGRTAPRINVDRVVRQLDELLAVPSAQSPFIVPVFAALGEAGPPKGLDDAWRVSLVAAVEGQIYGGFRAYRDFLKNELAPRARETPGIVSLPGGDVCYRARIRRETGLERGPRQVHELGLAEVARIEAEMQRIVTASGGDSLAATLQRLSRAQGLTTSEALLDYNRELVARAQAALPRVFGRLPRTVVELKAIEAFREKDAPAAYYYSAPRDGSRPAYYYVNTYAPQTRLLYKMAALAFHEAVPGHHLQVALASENAELPEFQREMGQTAFVEGWALYAESLADELGLYRTADEKLGQLSYEMWRAVRLVVDTGIHALGWSRQKAIDYLVEKTGNDRGESENEVDRYIIWPGQALAYKLGQLEILALRQQAEKALGPRFDLRGFHDEVLGQGAVPLPTLRRQIEAYIGARAAGAD